MEIPKKKKNEETEPIFEGLYLGKAYHILVKLGEGFSTIKIVWFHKKHRVTYI